MPNETYQCESECGSPANTVLQGQYFCYPCYTQRLRDVSEDERAELENIVQCRCGVTFTSQLQGQSGLCRDCKRELFGN